MRRSARRFFAGRCSATTPAERPDFVIHSYTKDLSGTGSVIAGVVIGRNEDMFLPKGESAGGVSWNETMFWNVYYVKGAFLNADAAFEVLAGNSDARSADARQVHQHADPCRSSSTRIRRFKFIAMHCRAIRIRRCARS